MGEFQDHWARKYCDIRWRVQLFVLISPHQIHDKINQSLFNRASALCAAIPRLIPQDSLAPRGPAYSPRYTPYQHCLHHEVCLMHEWLDIFVLSCIPAAVMIFLLGPVSEFKKCISGGFFCLWPQNPDLEHPITTKLTAPEKRTMVSYMQLQCWNLDV